jgi:hypothetical protein
LRCIELDVERAGRVGDQGDAGQQACLEPGSVVRRTSDGAPQQLDALETLSMEVPQPRQRGGEAAAVFGVGRRQSPVQGRSQIAVLELELGAPGIHVALQLGFDRLREGKDMGEMATAGGRDLAGFIQPVGSELPDGLEEPESCLAAALLGNDEGLVHQAPDGVEHVLAGDRSRGGDRTRGLQAEPAGEHGQPAEDDPV